MSDVFGFDISFQYNIILIYTQIYSVFQMLFVMRAQCMFCW